MSTATMNNQMNTGFVQSTAEERFWGAFQFFIRQYITYGGTVFITYLSTIVGMELLLDAEAFEWSHVPVKSAYLFIVMFMGFMSIPQTNRDLSLLNQYGMRRKQIFRFFLTVDMVKALFLIVISHLGLWVVTSIDGNTQYFIFADFVGRMQVSYIGQFILMMTGSMALFTFVRLFGACVGVLNKWVIALLFVVLPVAIILSVVGDDFSGGVWMGHYIFGFYESVDPNKIVDFNVWYPVFSSSITTVICAGLNFVMIQRKSLSMPSH